MISFLMPRAGFEQLGRQIAELLAATPLPARKAAAKRPSSGK
jgi:hypothetical protein